jgi:hypothetical protein
MSAKKDPDWLKPGDDGSMIVTLSKPFEVNGAKLSYLTMREPSVDDQIISGDVRGSEAVKEVHLFSNLCTVAPADLRKLPVRDYLRLQAAFANFID